jgi:hypothetical protein
VLPNLLLNPHHPPLIISSIHEMHVRVLSLLLLFFFHPKHCFKVKEIKKRSHHPDEFIILQPRSQPGKEQPVIPIY